MWVHEHLDHGRAKPLAMQIPKHFLSRLWPITLAAVVFVCPLVGCEEGIETPEAEPAASSLSSAASSLKTALVGVRVSRGGQLAIVFGAKKDYPFVAEHNQGDLRVEVRDAHSAALLGTATATLPKLCDCPQTESHFEGDVEIPHETTILLKVPYSTGSETLTAVSHHAPDRAPTTATRNLAEVTQ